MEISLVLARPTALLGLVRCWRGWFLLGRPAAPLSPSRALALAQLVSQHLLLCLGTGDSNGFGQRGHRLDTETAESSRDSSPVVGHQSLEKHNVESWGKLWLQGRADSRAGREPSRTRRAGAAATQGTQSSQDQAVSAAQADTHTQSTWTQTCTQRPRRSARWEQQHVHTQAAPAARSASPLCPPQMPSLGGNHACVHVCMRTYAHMYAMPQLSPACAVAVAAPVSPAPHTDCAPRGWAAVSHELFCSRLSCTCLWHWAPEPPALLAGPHSCVFGSDFPCWCAPTAQGHSALLPMLHRCTWPPQPQAQLLRLALCLACTPHGEPLVQESSYVSHSIRPNKLMIELAQCAAASTHASCLTSGSSSGVTQQWDRPAGPSAAGAPGTLLLHPMPR